MLLRRGVLARGCAVVVLVVLCQAAVTSAADWKLEDTKTTWKMKGKVKKPDDVSGAAVIGRHGILVSDETRHIQPFKVDKNDPELKVDDAVLIPIGDEGDGEFDLEGAAAATEEDWFYVTGSHSVKRTTNAVQPERKRVFRIPYDDDTNELTVDDFEEATLEHVIEADAKLKASLDKSSDDDGLDIEGLAERGGTLFFGVRSPNLDGHAFVLEIDADELFKNPQTVTMRTHKLSLREGDGIREIATIDDGFLVLTGIAADAEGAAGFELHYWSGSGEELVRIGDVSQAAGKAEGLLVLQEKKKSIRLLVLYDGVDEGAPHEFKITKP